MKKRSKQQLFKVIRNAQRIVIFFALYWEPSMFTRSFLVKVRTTENLREAIVA